MRREKKDVAEMLFVCLSIFFFLQFMSFSVFYPSSLIHEHVMVGTRRKRLVYCHLSQLDFFRSVSTQHESLHVPKLSC